ncbi:hypothetical protein SAMN05216266_116103 [Amycolatopsis marina]|uniref:Uncharacterized protein n=1 Tax=Amycolatopsis marina TaxID=490629 RepID=A0A1I1BT68_9PSEU|nr:hypothetical protein [Amycolatopsis marina]SFB52886.1 hypothetical protein SAMN05216266_116103 [Amycolatopsis marina]
MTATGKASPSTVHIVVTCTNRKQVPVPEHLRLGDLRDRQPGPRFAAWTRRLSADEPAIAARDLYGGEHWRAAAGLPSVVGDSAQLWVCSAGYGLVSVDTLLHPYAATFSAGTPDSVGRGVGELQRWWQRLADWPGPMRGQPRSFVELARRDPEASIVAVMSEAYLRACAEDLRAAAAKLSDPDRFAVIGPPRLRSDLEDLLVPVTARLRPMVGGSLHALHAKAATYLMARAGGDVTSRKRLREIAQQAAEAAPADGSRKPGVRLSDEEVREYIRRRASHGRPSATVLLRSLRDDGMSCEQSRFKRLYENAVSRAVLA